MFIDPQYIFCVIHQVDSDVATSTASSSSKGLLICKTVILCPYCLFGCLRQPKFDEHIVKMHSEDYPAFRCSVCLFSDKQRSQINDHIQLKNMENPWACHLDAKCDRTSPNSAEFLRLASIPKGVDFGWRRAEADGTICYDGKESAETLLNPPKAGLKLVI